jgi:hypothetical protein
MDPLHRASQRLEGCPCADPWILAVSRWMPLAFKNLGRGVF